MVQLSRISPGRWDFPLTPCDLVLSMEKEKKRLWTVIILWINPFSGAVHEAERCFRKDSANKRFSELQVANCMGSTLQVHYREYPWKHLGRALNLFSAVLPPSADATNSTTPAISVIRAHKPTLDPKGYPVVELQETLIVYFCHQ